MLTLADLKAGFSRPGRIEWIGLRPERRAPMRAVTEADLTEAGLEGDRHPAPGKRALTLIQAEHLPVIAALAGNERVDPDTLRRNLVISGVNLLALRGRLVQLGGALIEITGPCAPCSRMEDALGPGGYNAMRGHGGVIARVLEPGCVSRGDPVRPAGSALEVRPPAG